eukprot:EC799033.1.p1 GENE.EC799033.1~~EC799033.1.p1  ORF type:complete len:193 (+),score=57.28 EC799033.1:67-579(+)
MNYVFKMQNVTSHLVDNCVKSTPAGEAWQCFWAEFSLPLTKSPVFVINSLYDAWQMGNIFMTQAPAWKECAGKLDSCTSSEISVTNSIFQKRMLDRVLTQLQPKDGAFLFSCWSHCQSYGPGGFDGIKINGVSVAKALGDWYYGRASHNVYVDCTLNQSSPHECNSSCSA